jgi:Prokaryotic E2 family E
MELLQVDREYLDQKKFRYETFLHGQSLALLIYDFPLSVGYQIASTDLLILLPGGFPDAAPDMWWCDPWVKLASGADPLGASVREQIGPRAWQRFSRHFGTSRWGPGRSGVESYVTLIKADLARGGQAA